MRHSEFIFCERFKQVSVTGGTVLRNHDAHKHRLSHWKQSYCSSSVAAETNNVARHVKLGWKNLCRPSINARNPMQMLPGEEYSSEIMLAMTRYS